MSVDEDLLELDDIQGVVVPGFLKPHQALVYVWLPEASEAPDALTAVRRWLAGKAFSSGRTALDDRRAIRPADADALSLRGEHRRRVLENLHGHAGCARAPLQAVAFTAKGMANLGALAREWLGKMPGQAFRLGLAKRSGLLGDYRTQDDEGHPSRWVIGNPDDEPDAMIIVAGDDDAQALVRSMATHMAKELQDLGARASTQWGDVRADLPGFEHFGFKDGISQPGIRGRASEKPGDYLTERHLPFTDPERDFFGYPGQHLVWPGEFVFGYPPSSPDPLIPGREREVPDWMRNGSFLVYRRLRQDVAAFNAVMESEARRLRGCTGFETMTTELLKAKVMGRWPSGAPISRSPMGDDLELARDPLANNDFRFDDDGPPRHFPRTSVHTFPPAKADVVGPICPVAAHIRKVNVRDQASDVGGASATQSRRILRVGIPYGDPLPARGADPLAGDRGILFLCVQTSIEDQFEFLQSRWINNASRPRGPGGHDMVAGQNAAAEGGVRECLLFGRELQMERMSTSTQFVTATGGGYFFVPSISALRRILE